MNLTTNGSDDRVSGRSREEKSSGELSETEEAEDKFDRKKRICEKCETGS